MSKILFMTLVVIFSFSRVEAKKNSASKKKSFEEIIFKISPQLEKDLNAQGTTLDKMSLTKGFVKIEGPFEGRNQYFLFPGKPSDLIIHDVQGAELELKQDFKFYLVKNGEITNVERSKVFPEAKIKSAFLNGRKILDKMKKEQEWKHHIESFELPTKGREIKLILSNDDPNFFDNKSAEKATIATMKWTGAKFVLQKVPQVRIKKMAE